MGLIACGGARGRSFPSSTGAVNKRGSGRSCGPGAGGGGCGPERGDGCCAGTEAWFKVWGLGFRV